MLYCIKYTDTQSDGDYLFSSSRAPVGAKNMKKVSWQTNGRSEVFIQAKSSVVNYLSEYYSFDFNDLISSVGGNLGLFLGWSFLTFVEAIGFIVVLINIEKYLKAK